MSTANQPEKIHMIQCLCSNLRHAIMGIAYDPAALTPEDAMSGFKEVVQELLEKKAINPWCRICRSPQSAWIYEDARTIFSTIEEARPFLEASEYAQKLSGDMLEPGRN